MLRSSQHASNFIQELAALVEQLAKRDITVNSLRADYASFGSWILIAYKNHEAIRFTWDGRDGFITIESSPQTNQNSPNEWKQENMKGLDVRSGVSPTCFVEQYLQTRFPT